MPGGAAKILVAIADVDALVKKQSALDDHARHNTTSVYTAAEIFPMLPEKLSTDLTSLNFESDRLAIVVEMVVAADGSLQSSDIYRATVRNHAKLAYNSVAAWLEGNGPMPPGIGAVAGLDENLRLQDSVAQKLKALRHVHGALNLETIEARPVFDGDELKDLEAEKKNRAKDIIEDFMIAANGVTARYLAGKNVAVVAARCPHTQTLGPNRRAGLGPWLHIARRSRTPRPWNNFWFRRKPPIRSAFPIFPSASSSSWVPVNMSSNFREAVPPDTSVLRSGIILTPRRRTAAIPI